MWIISFLKTKKIVTLICHTERFGNPNDVMWKLIVQSNLSVYCNYCNTDVDKPWDMFYQLWDLRIWDLNEINDKESIDFQWDMYE